jgi:hypothetical protein
MLALVALLLLVTPAARADDVALPDTPAGRAATGWFRAFNGAESDMKQLYQTGYAPGGRTLEERMSRWRDMRGQIGTLTPLRTITAAERSIDVLARDGHDGFAHVVVEVTPADPALIVGVRIEPADPSEATSTDNSPLTEAQAVDSIAARTDALARAERSVVVSSTGQRRARTRCEANREKYVANESIRNSTLAR